MAARNKDQRSDQDGGLSSSSNPTSLFKMSKLETEGLIHSAFKLTRHSRTQDLNTQLDTVDGGGSGEDRTESYPVCHGIAENHVLNLIAVFACTESAGSHVHSHRERQAPAMPNHPVNTRYVSWAEGHNWHKLALYNTPPS